LDEEPYNAVVPAVGRPVNRAKAHGPGSVEIRAELGKQLDYPQVPKTGSDAERGIAGGVPGIGIGASGQKHFSYVALVK
jgi:hypothetical protein